MGSRAHYVVKVGGEWQLRYSHWGAGTVDRDIFWGPEHTVRFIEAQALCDPDDWMADFWCEGAVLVDADRRRLLFYGGKASGSILGGRVYVTMLRAAWRGWDVRPVDDLGDIVAALGLDRSMVDNDIDVDPLPADWATPDGSSVFAVLTMARGSRIDAFAVGHVVLLDDLIAAGPDRLMEATSGSAVTLDDVPSGGLHLDCDCRTVYWWPSEQRRDRLFASAWASWTLRPLGDRFEEHVELAAGKLDIRVPSEAEVVAQVKDHLLSESDTDPADLRQRMEARLGPVAFSPNFDLHVPVRPPREERLALLGGVASPGHPEEPSGSACSRSRARARRLALRFANLIGRRLARIPGLSGVGRQRGQQLGQNRLISLDRHPGLVNNPPRVEFVPPEVVAADPWLQGAAAAIAKTSIIGRVALITRTIERTAAGLGIRLDGPLAEEIDHLWMFVERGGWPDGELSWEERQTLVWEVDDWRWGQGSLPEAMTSVPRSILSMLVWGREAALSHAYSSIIGHGEDSLQQVLLALREARLAGIEPPDPEAYAATSSFSPRSEPGEYWREWGTLTSRSSFP